MASLSMLAGLSILLAGPAASGKTDHPHAVVASPPPGAACHRRLNTASISDIKISGTLVRREAFGPPYWGERPKTDTRYFYWVVKLDLPITVTTGSDIGMPTQVLTVREMQIQFGSRMGNVKSVFRGKHVVVQGMVNTQVFMTDETPVVINASSMMAGGPIPCGN